MTQHRPELTSNDVSRMQQVANDGEKLITKLDTHHRGFVTPDELSQASKDTHLSAQERQTAAELVKLQEQIRYERMGHLPTLDIGGARAAGAAGAGGPDAPIEPSKNSTAGSAHGERAVDAVPSKAPRPGDMGSPPAESTAAAGPGRPADLSKNISVSDLHDFKRDLDDRQVAMVVKKNGAKGLADELISDFGHNGKLMPKDVWTGVANLENKKQLTEKEQDELTALHYIQKDQRELIQAYNHNPKDGKAFLDMAVKDPFSLIGQLDYVKRSSYENTSLK